jgi:mRNA interferase RelE/StbE
LTLRYESRAIKDLKRLSEGDRRKIAEALEAFARDGLGDVQKLVDRPGYRLRIGRFRAIFDRVIDTIVVLRVFDRKEAYR